MSSQAMAGAVKLGLMKQLIITFLCSVFLLVSAGCSNGPMANEPVSGEKESSSDEHFVFPDDPPPEPEGYRMKNYRTVVPLTLKGATVVDDKAAMELYSAKQTIFIDVMPFTPKPPNLPKGMIWRDKKRQSIPDSIWLANVGYGKLPTEMDKFFRDQLKGLAKGAKDTPLLFFCQKDCWMSWNAAKRAMEYGYSKIYWYPVGTDGWVTIGGELADTKPVELPQMTRPLTVSP